MATGHFWVHAGQEPPKPETGRLCFGAAAGDGQLTAERMPIIGDLQRQLHGPNFRRAPTYYLLRLQSQCAHQI